MPDEELIYDHIRRRLRELRRSHPQTNAKTTQEDLARACGIDRSTLANIEVGNQRPTIFVVFRACNFFGVGLSDLLPDLESIYSDANAAIRIGGSEHQLGGAKTLELIRTLRSKSA